MSELCAYKVFYGNRNTTMYASSQLEAKEKGIAFYNVPISRRHMVTPVLVEKQGQAVQQVLS